MLLNCGVGEDSWKFFGLQRIQPIHPKGDQSWVFNGRTDVEAETPIIWLPDAKSWLIWKDSDAGKDWGQEEKAMTEDEMAGRHHRLNGHKFGQCPNSGSWWWTGRPGVLQFMWSQRVRHNRATEFNDNIQIHIIWISTEEYFASMEWEWYPKLISDSSYHWLCTLQLSSR